MRKIDTEAHFYTKEYQDYLLSRKEIPREEVYKNYIRLWYAEKLWEPHGPVIEDRLLDLAEGRLKSMDKAGIDIQMLSLSTPGCEQFSPKEGLALARQTNEALAKTISRYPDRFIGLATVALQSPEEAAHETERAIKELGLRGEIGRAHV
jgi:predicted TIM-barrel fold metal-dependent hydrolase